MKRYKVRILNSAKADMLEAKHWYEGQKPGLGKRFISDFYQKAKALELNPHFAIQYEDVRGFLFKNSPTQFILE